MRILRVRRGFQADHSSSSYLFYAADRPVSDKGQRVAHRFSSRADVDERSARYLEAIPKKKEETVEQGGDLAKIEAEEQKMEEDPNKIAF